MNTNEKEKLLQELKDAIELETQIITQETMLTQQKEVWETKKPVLQVLDTPADTQDYEELGAKGSQIVAPCLSTGIPGFIMTVATLATIGNNGNSAILLLISIPLLIFSVSWLIYNINKREQITLANTDKQNHYADICNDTKKKNEELKSVYNQDMLEWNKSLETLNTYITQPLSATRTLLSKLYDTTAIYPKYRNLPALTSILEYFETGRCDELSGPHGAYNIYEDERRKDTVISQLNLVIDNLEKIKNSQYMLYQQVTSIQQNTAIVIDELEQVKGYTLITAQMTALNAYYAKVNAINSGICASHDLLY